VRALVLVISVVTCGCGTRTDLASGNDAGVTSSAEDTYADRFAQAVCAASMPCCLEPAADCVEKTRTYVQEQQSAARARHSTFDATAGAACIEAYGRLLTGCPNRKVVDGYALEVCARVYPGSAPLGGACDPELFTKCADAAAVCSITKTGGHCAEDPIPASCKACVGRTCSGGECVDFPRAGEPCISTLGDSCAPGAVCVPIGSVAKGVCREPTPAGAACHERSDCELWACRDGVCASPIETWYLACRR
jgi:hypothetical protein